MWILLTTAVILLAIIALLVFGGRRRRGAPGIHDGQTHIVDQRRLRDARHEPGSTGGEDMGI